MTEIAKDPGGPAAPARAVKTKGQPIRWWLLVVSVGLFVISLLLVKEGARPLALPLRTFFSINSPLGSLGFGWLFATLILSGSPVAATALAFFDAEVLTAAETFTMIAGSRVGAAFVVLFIGFVYVLRGRKSEGSLNAGILSLLVTQTIYLPSTLLGYWMINGIVLTGIPVNPAAASSPFEILFDPALALLASILPVPWFFPLGFGVMVGSFWLFDQALPEFGLAQTSVGRFNRLLYRPLVSFALGAALTALTMSVSVSLGLLVPLSNRGYIRQENAIPYIMGANITTFIDTLIAAGLLGNPQAVTIVIVQMLSVALVSLLLLILVFRPYESIVSRAADAIIASRTVLGIYLGLTLLTPLVLLLAL